MSIQDVFDGTAAWTVAEGDALSLLRSMPDNSVHCVVSSCPYWGLRSYPVPPLIWDGDPDCDHNFTNETVLLTATGGTESSGLQRDGRRESVRVAGAKAATERQMHQGAPSAFCLRCNAWRGQLGLEPDPALFITHLVAIFREVRRVLHPSGTLWLNCGDSYSGSGKGQMRDGSHHANPSDKQASNKGTIAAVGLPKLLGRQGEPMGLPAKSLLMMPARLALALQADGWVLRSDVIWAKPNPMPGSQQDRPTTSHEHIFLLAKQGRYYFDAEAVREPHKVESLARYKYAHHPTADPDAIPGSRHDRIITGWNSLETLGDGMNPAGRMIRDVWTIPSEASHEAHYASFPREIPRRCIAAGCPSDGIVLDPFSGTSTTGVAALQQGRRFIGLELAPSYVAISERRLRRVVAVVRPEQQLAAHVNQQGTLAL